jgi:hypothetical protein
MARTATIEPLPLVTCCDVVEKAADERHSESNEDGEVTTARPPSHGSPAGGIEHRR